MLDDESAVSRIDKSNMLDTLADLPGQIKDALQIIKTANIPDFVKIDNVIVTGMGASGISGDIVNDVFYDKLEALYQNGLIKTRCQYSSAIQVTLRKQ
jgi:glucose-6-phosphate isomerase